MLRLRRRWRRRLVAALLVALGVIAAVAFAATEPDLGVDTSRVPVVARGSTDYDFILKAADTAKAQAIRDQSVEALAAVKEALLRAIDLQPDRPEAELALGRLYLDWAITRRTHLLESGAFLGKAEEALATALEKGLDDDPTRLALAALHLHNDDLDEGQDLIQAVCIHVRGTKAWQQVAAPITEDVTDEKRHEVLLVALRSLMREISPGDWVSIGTGEDLGRFYLEQGRLADAERVLLENQADYEAWLAKNGNTLHWGCPFQALGLVQGRRGRVDQRLESYRRSAELESNAVEKQLDMVSRCYRLGDYECSEKYATRALRLDPNGDDSRMYYAFVLMAEGRMSEADAILNASPSGVLDKVERSAGLDGYYVAMGHRRLVARDFDGARAYFAKATRPWSLGRVNFVYELNPDFIDPPEFYYVMAYLGMAWMETAEGRFRDSLPYYDRILDHSPRHTLALLGKGKSLVALGRVDEARAYYEKVLNGFPDHPIALAEMGMLELEKNNVDEAEKFFQHAVAHAPAGYSCPYTGLGMVYLARGDRDRARQALETAVNGPEDFDFRKYNTLAKIYLEDGRRDEAKELLEHSVRNFPAQSTAQAMLAALAVRDGAPKPAH